MTVIFRSIINVDFINLCVLLYILLCCKFEILTGCTYLFYSVFGAIFVNCDRLLVKDVFLL
jgi:hypothetical protein